MSELRLKPLTLVMGGNSENKTSCQNLLILCLIEINVCLEQHLSLFPNLCTRENDTCPFLKCWGCLIKAFGNYFALKKTFCPFILHDMGQLHLIAARLETRASTVVESEVTSNLH